jgi:hypothetical protein
LDEAPDFVNEVGNGRARAARIAPDHAGPVRLQTEEMKEAMDGIVGHQRRRIGARDGK